MRWNLAKGAPMIGLVVSLMSACTAADDASLGPLEPTGRAPSFATAGVARIEVTATGADPRTNSFPIGARSRFGLRLLDAQGTVITGRRVQWSSFAPRIATVDSTGVVTMVSAGNVGIKVVVDGVVGGRWFDVRTDSIASPAIMEPATAAVPAPPAATQPATVPLAPAATPPATVPAADTVIVSGERVARVEVAATGADPRTNSFATGVSSRFTARVIGVQGSVLTNRRVEWRSGDTRLVRVDSTGLVTMLAPGNVGVTATVEGVVGARYFDVVGQPVSLIDSAAYGSTFTATPVVTTSGGVPLTIKRFDSGTGRILVSSAIPLRAGMLRPGQESLVHVRIAGNELPIYAKTLASVHADGSARSVLVQFEMSLGSSQSLSAELVVGGARSAAYSIAAPAIAPAVPAAAALPSSSDYLVSTDLVGRTATSAAASRLGLDYALYESSFGPAADAMWSREGARWEGNYYDRALIYYAQWVRTANPTYWWRANQIATNYRREYIEANRYAPSAHWSQLEGLEKHYLTTGDEASRVAVVQVANGFTTWQPQYYLIRTSDARILARALHGALLAWRLTPGGQAPTGVSARNWGGQIDAWLTQVLQAQAADGSYPQDLICGGQLNYMIGMLNDAMIRVHEQYRADPRIVTAVTRSADQLWNTQWLPLSGAFRYASVSCPNVGGGEAAGDLNGLLQTTFSWVARQSGQSAHASRAEQVFAGLVRNWALGGTKQFNQAYTFSFRHYGYR